MYLVDTDVLSACAPTKAERPERLIEWLDRNSDRLYLSVVTVAEIEDGIAKSRREGATRKAQRLAEWLQATLHLYADRILPLDIAAARCLGALADRARSAGLAPGWPDLAIAAIALARKQTILTRNLRHFQVTGIPVHDPLATLP